MRLRSLTDSVDNVSHGEAKSGRHPLYDLIKASASSIAVNGSRDKRTAALHPTTHSVAKLSYMIDLAACSNNQPIGHIEPTTVRLGR